MNKLEEKIVARYELWKDDPDIVAETLEETNFAWKALSRYLPADCTGKLLDVGCGKGRFSRRLKDLGFDVTGVDPAEGLITIAKHNNLDINFGVESATGLSFEEAYFDVVICVSVLEQIPDTEKVISEMSRVLKPGGLLLILDKNRFSLHPRYMVPTQIWIKWFGEENKWKIFPKDFEFQEIYFVPWKLNSIIKKYFQKSDVHYIRYTTEEKSYPIIKGILIGVRTVAIFIQHTIFPFLDYYVIWRAEK